MSHLITTLNNIMEPEDVVDCYECGGLYDLRFWTFRETVVICPNCNSPRDTADVIQERRG